MMPTILDALGLSDELCLQFTAPVRLTFPQDMVVDQREVQLHGHSLLPLLFGECESVRDFAVTTHFRAQWAIRTDEWSYLFNLDGRPPELYHRATDPQEEHNVLEEHREVADALELTLRRFADEIERRL